MGTEPGPLRRRRGTLPQARLQRACRGETARRSEQTHRGRPSDPTPPRAAPSAPHNPPGSLRAHHSLSPLQPQHRFASSQPSQPSRCSPAAPHLTSAPLALRPLPRGVSRHSCPTAPSARAVRSSAPRRPFLHEALRHWPAGAT